MWDMKGMFVLLGDMGILLPGSGAYHKAGWWAYIGVHLAQSSPGTSGRLVNIDH